jgi:hypothetical protein
MAKGMMWWARTALVCAGIGLASVAGATQFSTNFSDLWWVPAESGWGANVSQQADVMIVTFFVYGPSGQPTWYVATLDYTGAATDGSLVFTGDLYQTAGPWFGAVWNPSLYGSRKAGVAIFQTNVVAQATLSYMVDGTFVTKQIERQSLRNNDFSGSYYGGTSEVSYSCGNPSSNNQKNTDLGALAVTHNGLLISLKAPTCTYSGTYVQQGQIGRADTAFVCTNGAVGTTTFFDMHVETSGIVGRYTAHDAFCDYDGNFGGVRLK